MEYEISFCRNPHCYYNKRAQVLCIKVMLEFQEFYLCKHHLQDFNYEISKINNAGLCLRFKIYIELLFKYKIFVSNQKKQLLKNLLDDNSDLKKRKQQLEYSFIEYILKYKNISKAERLFNLDMQQLGNSINLNTLTLTFLYTDGTGILVQTSTPSNKIKFFISKFRKLKK